MNVSLSRRIQMAGLVLLCVLVYARSLSLPLLEDDYPNITYAQTYGTWAGLPAMVHTGLFLLRATGQWLIAGLWALLGFQPVAFRLVSLLLHIANVFLAFWFCLAVPGTRAAAFWIAAFFAIHEGHQEAIMWFSAINELLMFFFGMASLLCWARALESAREWWLRGAALLLFGLALLSKESAVIFLPLYILMTPRREWRRCLPALIPFAALALGAVAVVVSTRSYSFRFTDGSFSPHAPVWLTWPRSFGRILWIWGWIALAWLLLRNKIAGLRAAAPALIWIGVGLIPYSFLTYSTAIPSRQTYLASFGLAMLVGLALLDFGAANRMRTFVLVACVMLIHNAGYIWTTKQKQFAERAAPTEQLLTMVRSSPGLVWVKCFPKPTIVAEQAVRIALGRDPAQALWSAASKEIKPAATFCYERR